MVFCYIAASIPAISTVIAKAVDFGTRGRMYIIEEPTFLQMIYEVLKGADQDKIRKTKQEQAKQRANEPLAVEGVEPAAEGQVFYFCIREGSIFAK